ncbi:MAG: hypothetical protein FJ296_02440 [Planctomycetes bacterium]|nr:hypothetical protein [Planctomycetota bacterium]
MPQAVGRSLVSSVFVALLAAPLAGQSLMFRHVGSSAGSGWGYKVRALRDVDGDGLQDYFIGSRLQAKGEVRSGATGTQLFEWGYGSTCFGMAAADVGDINGDGVPDLAVGAPRDIAPGNKIGSVFMMSGADGALLFKSFGTEVNGRFGLTLDAIGDVDGDGVTDLAVGDIWASSQVIHGGSASVVSGATGLKLHSAFGSAASDYFGHGISAAGDLDLDGVPDYVVGAPHEFTFLLPWPPGYVRTFSGATGAQLAQFTGTQVNDYLGLSVAGGRDLTGDGVPELVPGAPGQLTGGVTGGQVRLVDGASSAVLATREGLAFSQTGAYLRMMGDFDGDGTDDVLSGSCYGVGKIGETFPGEGYVEVLSGAGLAVLAQVSGADLTRFGRSVDDMGDLNGDGVPELLVGAPETAELGEGTGNTFLFSGATLPLTSDVHELPWSATVQQNLALDLGRAHAGDDYFVLGSLTGTSPGLALPSGTTLPLNDDFYFVFTLTSGNSPVLTDFSGTLDRAGAAAAQFNVPAGILDAQAIGLTVHHAAVVRHGGQVVKVTNPVPLTFIP